VYESCHVVKSHVTCEWVTSQAEWGWCGLFLRCNLPSAESWHNGMSHGTSGWVMAHRDESWHIIMHYDTYTWVIARSNGPCHRQNVFSVADRTFSLWYNEWCHRLSLSLSLSLSIDRENTLHYTASHCNTLRRMCSLWYRMRSLWYHLPSHGSCHI